MARRIPRVSIIDIDESDDGSDEQTIRATKLVKASQAYGQSLSNRTATRHASRGIPQDVAVIDVDAEEDLMERHKAELDLEMDGLEFNDIADRKSRSVSVDSSRTVGRDTPPPSDYMRNIGEYDFGKGFVLREDMVVPVKKGFMIAEQQVDFVKVVAMLRDLSTGLVYVQGYVFTRLCNLGGMLDPKLNEVAMLVQEDNSNQVDFQQHRLVKVPLYRIVPRERQLHITNACFPQFRFPVDDLTHLHDQDQAKNWVKENSWLTCRWFFIRRYSNREHMESGGKALESEVRAVSEDDSDDAFKVKDEYKLNDWRGGKIPGGSSLPNGEKVKMILDLDGEDRARNVHIRPGQTYDAGDFFAGAGGVSRGIFDAGARVSLAVDHWAPASASYQANFPTTELRQVDIFDHIIDSETRSHLDLLHLSPPCQVYSPAHTRPGRNDEVFQAHTTSALALVA